MDRADAGQSRRVGLSFEDGIGLAQVEPGQIAPQPVAIAAIIVRQGFVLLAHDIEGSTTRRLAKQAKSSECYWPISSHLGDVGWKVP